MDISYSRFRANFLIDCKMSPFGPPTCDGTPKNLQHVILVHEGYATICGAILVEGVNKAGDGINFLAG